MGPWKIVKVGVPWQYLSQGNTPFGNIYSPTIIIAIVTEYSGKKASYPICVVLKKGRGLKKDSIVNLSQIRTIDKKRLIAPKVTQLSNDVMKQVDKAIIYSMGLHKL